MKKLTLILATHLLLGGTSALFAAKDPKPAATDAQIAAYPLTTCVVSDDKLGGDMGAPIDYIYKEEGKPDRLIRFCCKDCIKDFKKEPAKYVAKLDQAEADKKKAKQ